MLVFSMSSADDNISVQGTSGHQGRCLISFKTDSIGQTSVHMLKPKISCVWEPEMVISSLKSFILPFEFPLARFRITLNLNKKLFLLSTSIGHHLNQASNSR